MIKTFKKLLINHYVEIIIGFLYINLVYLSYNIPDGTKHIILKYFAFSIFEPFTHEGYFLYIIKASVLFAILGLPAGLAASSITKKLAKSGKKP